MKRIFFISFLSVSLISCGAHQGTTRSSHRDIIGKPSTHHRSHRTPKTSSKPKPEPIINDIEIEDEDLVRNDTDRGTHSVKQEIIDFAKSFEGTRYKFGGTTKAGMDCSGLICTAFERENIKLPRVSREMATKGVPVSLKNVEKGDLIFFKTSSRNVISHVGLVVEARKGEVKFIHSTTSAGVIISSLDEDYWRKAFAEVRRII